MRTTLPILLVLSACNQPPSAPGVAIGPEAPKTTDDLVASIVTDAVDENKKNVVTTSIAWFKDDVQQVHNGDTVPARDTKKGQVWRVEYLPNDGKEDGKAGTAEVTIANSPPTVEVSRVGAKSHFSDSDLQVEVVTADDDDDDVDVSYAWSVDGEATSHTGPKVDASETLKGQTWTVEVTPNDGDDDGVVGSIDFIVVNSTPTVAAARVDPQAAYTTTDVTCLGAAWNDPDPDDPETYRTVWWVNGKVVGEGSTLASEAFERSDKVSCQLFPKDEDVEGAPVTSAPVTVRNSAPTIGTPTLTPEGGTAVEGDTLRVSVPVFNDADGDQVIMTYEWQVNSSKVAEGNFLRSDSFTKGDLVNLKIMPFDGRNFGGPYWFKWDIENAAPSQPTVAVTPSSPRSSDDLWCDITAESVDADGDTVTYAFAWEKDGATYSGTVSETEHAGDTVPASETTDGDKWNCIVTPDDGDDFGDDGTDEVSVKDPS